MLTLFTTPKAFNGHFAVIQRNAIRSWMQLTPTPEIILFGHESGTAEIANEYALKHIPDTETSSLGTPLISSLFGLAQSAARYDLLCYLNADIMLLSDFPAAIQRIPHKRFLMVGQRSNLDITQPVDFAAGWEAQLREQVAARAVLEGPTGIDYFVFPRGLWGCIPDFAVGRPAWDNWMLYRARALKVPVIDTTNAVTAIHQNHDYSHLAGGTSAVWEGPEAKRNLELAGGYDHVFTLVDADWHMTADRLERANSPEFNARRKDTWRVLHPRIGGMITGIEKLNIPNRWRRFTKRLQRRLQRIAS